MARRVRTTARRAVGAELALGLYLGEEERMANGKRQMAKVKSVFLVFGHWFLVRFLGLSSLFAAPRVSNFEFPASSFEFAVSKPRAIQQSEQNAPPMDQGQRTRDQGRRDDTFDPLRVCGKMDLVGTTQGRLGSLESAINRETPSPTSSTPEQGLSRPVIRIRFRFNSGVGHQVGRPLEEPNVRSTRVDEASA